MLINIPSRTDKHWLSFLPDTIKDWNILEKDVKDSTSLPIFKNKILHKIRPSKKEYFGIVERDKIRYITLLRMGLSPLREHKFNKNVKDTSDPFCRVCGIIESMEHFLLHCNAFCLVRSTLVQNVSNNLGYDLLNIPNKKKIEVLLYGDSNLEGELNRKVFRRGYFIHYYVKQVWLLTLWVGGEVFLLFFLLCFLFIFSSQC